MGLTRTDLYTDRQVELAQLAKALGHPARIAIVEHLLKTNACITGQIVEHVGLAQATVSQHLRALKEAGIIRGNVEGNAVNYCIDPYRWQALRTFFNDLFDRYGCCAPDEDACC